MDEQIMGLIKSLTKRIDDIEKKFSSPVVRANELSDLNANDIEDERDGLMETFENTNQNTTDIVDCYNAIMELYESLNGEEE